MQTLESWRMRYERAGCMPFPLASNSKKPITESWLHEPLAQQWLDVGPSFKGNIGLVMGKGMAAIDCDEYKAPGTIARVTSGLASLGIDIPTVTTPSGGQHFYIRVVDVPSHFNFALLSEEIGAGELRAQHCYIAAPCSAVDDKRYKFTHGMIEDIQKLRPVSWKDLLWLLPPTVGTSAGIRSHVLTVTSLPVRLVWREMNQKTVALFNALKNAKQGAPIGHYPTRHNAEAAVVANLILCGWPFDEIARAFEQQQPAHWREHKRRDDYLQRTYRNVLTDIASTPERMQLATIYQAADNCAWPGRGGALDQRICQSLISKAWQFSAFDVRCAQREMTEHAAGSRKGAANASKRLQSAGLMEQRDSGTDEWGSLYTLKPEGILSKVAISHISTHRGQPQASQEKGLGVAECENAKKFSPNSDAAPTVKHVTNGDFWHSAAHAELWGYNGLGRAAGMVYRWLNDDVISIRDFIERTGKSQRTVYRALDALAEFELAEKVGDGWRRGKAQPAKVAKDLRCDEAAKRRRTRNEDERESWRRARDVRSHAAQYGTSTK